MTANTPYATNTYVSIDTTTPSIPMSRLAKVELRKLVDTRAGFWLIASMGLIATLIGVVVLIVNRNTPDDLTFENFFRLMNEPIGYLLPVMAILLVTSEWSQRTALATFTMEPRRARVIVAKLLAAVIAGIGAVAIVLVVGAVATVIAMAMGSGSHAWTFSGTALLYATVLQISGLLMGFGFAALFLNTPAAIVAYFIIPTVFSIAGTIIPWVSEHLGKWLAPGAAAAPFQMGQGVTGADWAHFLVANLVWIGIPMVFGIVRIMRSEVK